MNQNRHATAGPPKLPPLANQGRGSLAAGTEATAAAAAAKQRAHRRGNEPQYVSHGYASLTGEQALHEGMMGQLQAAEARQRIRQRQRELRRVNDFDMHVVLHNTRGALRAAQLKRMAGMREEPTGGGVVGGGGNGGDGRGRQRVLPAAAVERKRLEQLLEDDAGLSTRREPTYAKFWD